VYSGAVVVARSSPGMRSNEFRTFWENGRKAEKRGRQRTVGEGVGGRFFSGVGDACTLALMLTLAGLGVSRCSGGVVAATVGILSQFS
jgi:hypothetical protein